MREVPEIRRFNRFYTRQIGLLNEHLPASDLSLTEARVLYELATGGETTAAELCRRLDMDKAHLSRIAARFKARGMLVSRASPHHGKHQLLSLTAAGQAVYAAADQGTRQQIEKMLTPLDAAARQDLVDCMKRIETAFGAHAKSPPRLRALIPGDLGWVTHRQALLYHREYGWDMSYETLVSEIFGKFDPAREDGWIAEFNGEIAGSVFLMRGPDDHTGKLRLLYVEPAARGQGIGKMLVECCIARSRELGHRRLILWTNSVLDAARHIYIAAGFQLVAEEAHHSFGKDLVGQNWELNLAG